MGGNKNPHLPQLTRISTRKVAKTSEDSSDFSEEDEEWFYLQQDFVRDNQITARAVAKVTFLKNGKKIDPKLLLEKLNHRDEKPPMPEFLKDLLCGEKNLVNEVKSINKA